LFDIEAPGLPGVFFRLGKGSLIVVGAVSADDDGRMECFQAGTNAPRFFICL
jgi:hypothetical protein